MDAYEVDAGANSAPVDEDQQQQQQQQQRDYTAAEEVLSALSSPSSPASEPDQPAAAAPPALSQPAPPSLAGLDTALESKTEYDSVTVGDPQLGGNALRSHYTYAVAVEPPRPGVSMVRRRFNHFEWLRNALVTQFPGLFVPPLPPKQLFGRDTEFINERAEELTRFMQRLCQHPLFAATPAFTLFVTRHENSFDGGRKEIDRDVSRKGAIFDTLEVYLRCFPNALRRRLPDDADEGVLRLKTFLEESEATLVEQEKAASKAVEALSAAASQTAAVTRCVGRAAKIEDDYAQRPEPSRLDADDKLRHWTRQRRASCDFTAKHVQKAAQHELEDVRAFLEVIKTRGSMQSHYEKYRAKGDKWRNPDTTVTAKNEKTRDSDLKTEEDAQRTLEIVTKIILSDQVRRWWAAKVAAIEEEMRALALRIVVQARRDLDVWSDLVDSDEVERELETAAELEA